MNTSTILPIAVNVVLPSVVEAFKPTEVRPVISAPSIVCVPDPVAKLFTEIVSTFFVSRAEIETAALPSAPVAEIFNVSLPAPPSITSPALTVVATFAIVACMIPEIVSSPAPVARTSAVEVNVVVEDAILAVLEIRAFAEPIASNDPSNTVTLIPSRPSFSESAVGVMLNVAEVEPAEIVTVPERESRSLPVAFSTEASLSSPITLYVSVTSAAGAEDAVTVYVNEPPSATFVALAERE